MLTQNSNGGPRATPAHAAPRRDPIVIIGLGVVTIAAAIGSFSALRGTAELAGWSKDASPLLPVTVDTVAAVASRIWLSADTPTDTARRFARSVALGAIVVSLLGNGVYHLAEAGYVHPGVWLVIGAGGISPLALAITAHLAVLRGAVSDRTPAPEGATGPDAADAQTVVLPTVPAVVDRRVPASPDTASTGQRTVPAGGSDRTRAQPSGPVAPTGARPDSATDTRTPATEHRSAPDTNRTASDLPGHPDSAADSAPVAATGQAPDGRKRRASDAELMAACQTFAVENELAAEDLTRAQIKEAADAAGYSVSNDRVTRLALFLDEAAAGDRTPHRTP